MLLAQVAEAFFDIKRFLLIRMIASKETAFLFSPQRARRLLLISCSCDCLNFYDLKRPFLSVLLAALSGRELTEPFGLRCSRSLSGGRRAKPSAYRLTGKDADE